MMEERERLEVALQTATVLKTNTRKRVWEAEDTLRDKVTALEDAGRSYYSIAEDLKLVPRNARNAHNKDLSLEIDTR